MSPSFFPDDSNDDSMVYEEISVVEEKCEQYVQSYRLGEATTVEEFAGEFPALKSQILELLPTVLMMEDARQRNLGKRKDGRVNRGPEKIPDLGDFKIIQELGRGGMGIVYEAHQESLDRRVAIKLLPKHALKLNQIAKFCREAATAAKLHHTNIAPVYGVGESEGFHFYAMQLLKGFSLEKFVKNDDEESSQDDAELHRSPPVKTFLSIKDVVGIGRQVASALDYAHDQGVIHRDIKPSNLILDSDSTVWVTDFGLAVSLGNNELVGDGSVSGTLRYMAPEKFSGASDAPTEDIYSLGITLIELLSGNPAFEAQRVKELTADVRSGKIVRPKHKGKSLPGDLEAVLRKAVALDPTQRYQTAREFEEDLRNFSEGLPVHATPHTIAGNMWRWVKRNPALTVTSSLALSFLIAASDVSTVSYFKTQRALTAEHEQRVRAEKASDLAARALDKILDQFSTGSAVYNRPLETSEAPPRLTAESAAMLEELGDFYLQLATQNTNDMTELPLKALKAQCRVGEINKRLGRNEVAADAFRIALSGYQRLLNKGRIGDSVENVVWMAHLHNQLAVVEGNAGDEALATLEHDKSIKLLNAKIAKSQPADERLLLELARTYYFLGHQTRPGMGPNSLPPPVTGTLGDESPPSSSVDPFSDPERRASLEQAIELLTQIQSRPPQAGSVEIEKMASHLLSVSCRELANDIWTNRTKTDRTYQALALELLEGLVEKYPDETGYQFELMRTLAQINVFDLNPNLESASETIDEAYDSLRRAVDYGIGLRKAQPNVADYLIELIHANFKLGKIAALKSAFAESVERENLLLEQEHCYRRALLSQTMLVRMYPQSDVYKVWLARFSLSLAACETMKDRSENRNRLIGRAISVLNRLPAEILEKPEVNAIMNEAKLISRQSLIEPEL